MGIPDALAFCAASSLVLIPPTDTRAAVSKTSRWMSSVMASTVSRRRAVGSRRGIAGVEPVHVGEQDQEVGVDQMRDEGGEIVVVADLDLVHGHRVVLVDDGQDAEVEEREERVARVEVARAIADVLAA